MYCVGQLWPLPGNFPPMMAPPVPPAGHPKGLHPSSQQHPADQQSQQSSRRGTTSPYKPHIDAPNGAGSERQDADRSDRARPSRARLSGKLMTADEIEQILRIQYSATHSGHPYFEDYYHQAYVNKYLGGRNAATFTPDTVRDLYGSDVMAGARFADVSGLGKIVLSNIRTPKMLMDLGGSKHGAAGSGGSTHRPLEKEPLLAARIMIEDCMMLLMDVEDVDRIFTASNGAPAEAAALRTRRAALMSGITDSFGLPDTPKAKLTGAQGDGVFIRIVVLPKGRALLAKTLRLMFPPEQHMADKTGSQLDRVVNGCTALYAPGLTLVWALLRNSQSIFGPVPATATSDSEKRLLDVTEQLAAATAEVIKRLQTAKDVINCLSAFNWGVSLMPPDTVLPLFPAGRREPDASPDWLGNILAAILLRASELGLGSFAALGDQATDLQVNQDWQKQFNTFFGAVTAHLDILYAVKKGTSQALGAKGTLYVHALSCVPLVRVMMAHANDEQQERLKLYLSHLSY